MGCEPGEIVFTSGATESNNLALQGAIYPTLMKREPAHIITTEMEHKCVIEIACALKKMGAEWVHSGLVKLGACSYHAPILHLSSTEENEMTCT